MEEFKATDTRQLSILDLPIAAIDRVIDFLPPPSCLVLRQVSKSTNIWITNRSWRNNPIEIKKWKKERLCITGKGHRTFANVVRINLPITSFHLKNPESKQKIYGGDGVDDFLESYKSCPLTFFVNVVFSFQWPAEQHFYSSLKTLTELRIKKFKIWLPPALIKNGDNSLMSNFLPPPFSLLHSLRILYIKKYEHTSLVPADISDAYILSFFNSLKNIQLLSPPAKLKKIRDGFPWYFLSWKKTCCPNWVNALEAIIAPNNLRSKLSSQKETTQVIIDFRSLCENWLANRTYLNYVQTYVHLLQQIHQHNHLLQFVFSPLMESMYIHWRDSGLSTQDIQDNFKFLDNVTSMHGVCNLLFFGFSSMQRLEEISIYHNFVCHQWIYHNPPKLNWNSLKSLKLTVHTTDGEVTEAAKEVWDLTFSRIFKNITRKSVISLFLKIFSDTGWEENCKTMNFHQDIFNVSAITTHFIGLRSLTIHGWNAENNQVEDLISGLPHLRFISISKCKRVCDSTFSILPKGLKTLILNLNKMPLITGDIFDFLSKMSIKELRISSKKPLPFTAEAIKKLQEGIFGVTIEKFPFNTWQSKYFNEKEKMELRKGFQFLLY